MKTRETMRARAVPDVYSDRAVVRWWGSAEGDKDGYGVISEIVTLAAWTFPPGSILEIKEPVCPLCDSRPYNYNGKWECLDDACSFDWHAWAEEEFS